jgi:hypothetical protein
MALRKVQSGAIADNAITSAKIASGAVTAADLNSDVSTVINNVTVDTVFTGDSITLPAGTTAERPSSATIGMLRYNTDLAYLEQYTNLGWQVIAISPVISSVSPTTFNGASGTSFTISGTNFDYAASAKFITSNGSEFTAASVTFNNSTSLTITTPQNFTVANEPLSVKVINGTGLFYVLADVIDCGGLPSWSTTSGSLGTVIGRDAGSFTLSATDPESQTLSYSLASGSLPTNFTINSSTGVISGTAEDIIATTTYTFTIRATDTTGNYSDRSFSITIQATNYFGNGSDGVGTY